MKLNKMETAALWLLGLSVPVFFLGLLSFGGVTLGSVAGFYVGTIFGIIAFAIGLLLLLVSQIVKRFGKRS